jgi:PPK2 family polyphosphate:nucleotide phosphotransferase
LANRVAQKTETYRVVPGKQIHLAAIPTDAKGLYTGKKDARAELKNLKKQIGELVQRLGAESSRAVLVILQGVDAAGKDGAVRHVFSGMNPELCRVTAFREPDAEEQKHDYLWRIYRAMPEKGVLGVFNRSHYEDVLVLRARGKLSTQETKKRLRQIEDAERSWSENGITLRKFFLHISKREQAKRFQARLHNPDKHWKVEESDFEDRRRWPSFQRAYEEAIFHTAREPAPWYVVPADHKWYRDVVIADVLLDTLRSMDPKYPRRSLKELNLKV